MKRLAIVLLLILVVPAAAAAKGGHDDVAIKWLTLPGDTRGGETWRASFEIVDPNGNRYIMDAARPVVVASKDGREVRAAAFYGDAAGRYVTDVRFRDAGRYDVWVEGWDLRNPQRRAPLEPDTLTLIAPARAASAQSNGVPWSILIVLGPAVAALLFIAGASPLREHADRCAGSSSISR